ncbi:M23 family metallopeptidase [Chloroflexota bacterium]
MYLKPPILSLLFLLVISFTACGGPTLSSDMIVNNPSSTSESIPRIPSSTARLLVKNRATLSPVATSKQLPKITQSPTFLATALLPSLTPSVTHTPSRTPVSSLCSPLTDHLIEVLPKIVSDAYDPPPRGHDDRHHGVDFTYYNYLGRDYIQGVKVQSIFPAYVSASIPDSFPYGNLVILETPGSYLSSLLVEKLDIEEGESLYTLYAHLEKQPDLVLGDQIQACQIFNEVGRSGNSNVYHLHLETRIGPSNAKFETMSAFIDGATAKDRENYRRWRISGEFRHLDPMDLLLFDF